MNRLIVKRQLLRLVTRVPTSHLHTDWTLELEVVGAVSTSEHGDDASGAIIHNGQVAARLRATPGWRLVPNDAKGGGTLAVRPSSGQTCWQPCREMCFLGGVTQRTASFLGTLQGPVRAAATEIWTDCAFRVTPVLGQGDRRP